MTPKEVIELVHQQELPPRTRNGTLRIVGLRENGPRWRAYVLSYNEYFNENINRAVLEITPELHIIQFDWLRLDGGLASTNTVRAWTAAATIAAAVAGDVTVAAKIKLRCGLLTIADVVSDGRRSEIAALLKRKPARFELVALNRFD